MWSTLNCRPTLDVQIRISFNESSAVIQQKTLRISQTVTKKSSSADLAQL